MKLFKIDPQTKTVEVIESTGSLSDMCQHIDCRMIDVCARQDSGDCLTVDDESLFLEPQPAAFSFDGFGPIHGIAILSGTDEEGDAQEPIMSLEEATKRITWLGEIYTRPTLYLLSL